MRSLGSSLVVSLVGHAAALGVVGYWSISVTRVGQVALQVIEISGTGTGRESGVRRKAVSSARSRSHAVDPASVPAVSKGGGEVTGIEASAILREYVEAVVERIEKVKTPPRVTTLRGEENEVIVGISVSRDGRIENIQLIRGCPSKEINESALQTVLKASPFPPIPGELAEQLRFRVPLRFVL